MMQKQLVVLVSDLRFVSIECPLCKTVVTLDMKEPHELAKKHVNAFCPKQCPGCLRDYDTIIRPNVDAFQRAYHALLEMGERVSLRGVAEVESH